MTAATVTGGAPVEETGRSSITITRNAKGQAQWTIKCYAASSDPIDAERAYDQALDLDRRAVEHFGLPGGAS